MNKIFGSIFLVLVSPSLLSEQQVNSPRIESRNDKYDGYRLPTSSIPSRYDIHLTIPPEALSGANTTYSGLVKIIFQVTQSTNTIRLHSLVNVSNISLTSSDTSIMSVINSTVNSTSETLVILLSSNMNIGSNYTLEMFYSANLEIINMKGFYRSEYVVNGTKEYLASTKFEPTYARKAFPCFEEPQYKAVFSLTLTYPMGYTAVANTPILTSVNSTDSTTSIFEDSPLMSTYLLAFAVSKFSCTEDTSTTETIPYRVCSRPDSGDQRNLAVTFGTKVMAALQNWTNYSYSQMGIGKMDQMALPDFVSGAMENWGLVTYREYFLLWSQEYTSNYYKQKILTVIAHEFAHMWFGNLVTTQWWNSLFLNEGFATYFQYFALNMVSDTSNYEIEKQFIIEVQQTAFIADASLTSSSLTSDVWTPDQIKNKFSTISYSKGASVLRMVENIIGSTVFKSALRKYLVNNAFSTATPETLWNTVSAEVSDKNLPNGLNLTQVLDNWTNQPGFPVVTATLLGNNIVLRQKRFLYNGTDSTQWYIPITYVSPTANNSVSVWLEPDGNVTLQNSVDDNSWIIINHDSSGYYRVHYDDTLRDRLASALRTNHLQISDINRAQIIDDILNLARAGQIKYSHALQLLQYLKNETCYFPWFAAIKGLNHLIVKLGNDSVLGQRVASFFLDHVEHISANISTTKWNEIDQVTSLKLRLIWSLACRLGHAKCISESRKLFTEMRSSGASINPNIRDIVYCNALRYSDNITADWFFLWNRLNIVDQPQETQYILTGLGCARSKEHLSYYLDQSINSTSAIRIQDFAAVWSAVYSSGSVGLHTAFDYFVNNHNTILNYYSDAISVLSGIADRMTTDAEIFELQYFVKQQAINSTIAATATSALQLARENLKWQDSVRSDLDKYFGTDIAASAATQRNIICVLFLSIMFNSLLR